MPAPYNLTTNYMNVNFIKITHEYSKNLPNDRIQLKKGSMPLPKVKYPTSNQVTISDGCLTVFNHFFVISFIVRQDFGNIKFPGPRQCIGFESWQILIS